MITIRSPRQASLTRALPQLPRSGKAKAWRPCRFDFANKFATSGTLRSTVPPEICGLWHDQNVIIVQPVHKAIHQVFSHQTDRAVDFASSETSVKGGRETRAGSEGSRDLVGVMGEVVDNGDGVGGAHDLQSPADAAELAQDVGSTLGRGQCHEPSKHTIRQGHWRRCVVPELWLHRSGLIGIARLHPQSVSVGAGIGAEARRSADPARRLWVTACPGFRSAASAAVSALSRFSTAVCALAMSPRKRLRQLVDRRLVVKRDIVHDGHTWLEKCNRAVAFVDFADENITTAVNSGAGERRAWVDEVLHISAVHNRWAFSSAVPESTRSMPTVVDLPLVPATPRLLAALLKS